MNIDGSSLAALLQQVSAFYREGAISLDDRSYLKDLLLSSDAASIAEAQRQVLILRGEDPDAYAAEAAAAAYSPGLRYDEGEGAYYTDDPNAMYYQDEDGNVYQQPEPQYYQDEHGNMFTEAEVAAQQEQLAQQQEPVYYQDEDGNIFGADELAEMYDGYDAYTDEDGGVFFQPREPQSQLYEDEYGNVVDKYGRVVEYAPEEPQQQQYQDDYGNIVDEADRAEEEKPFYSPGYYETEAGEYVYVDEEGRMWTEDGEIDYNLWQQAAQQAAYEDAVYQLGLDRQRRQESKKTNWRKQSSALRQVVRQLKSTPRKGKGKGLPEKIPVLVSKSGKKYLRKVRSTHWREESDALRSKIQEAKRRGKKATRTFPKEVPILVPKKRFSQKWRKESRGLRQKVEQAKKLKTKTPEKVPLLISKTGAIPLKGPQPSPGGGRKPGIFNFGTENPKLRRLSQEQSAPLKDYNPVKKPHMKPVQKQQTTPWRRASSSLRETIQEAKAHKSPEPNSTKVEVHAATRLEKYRQASPGGGRKPGIFSFPNASGEKPKLRPLPQQASPSKKEFNPVAKPIMKPVQDAKKTPWRFNSQLLRAEVQEAKKLSPRAKEKGPGPTFEIVGPKKT